MTTTIHYEVGAGIVRCGLPMRSRMRPYGWDMGTASVALSDVTCAYCKSGERMPLTDVLYTGQCGNIADEAYEGSFVDPVCHQVRGHSGCCTGLTTSGVSGWHKKLGVNMAERYGLSAEQRSIYDEARDCGATHRDAMEAAETDGYTE